eukprot:scaffold251398_cov31-Tisochrysis_lutea.AAC.6
MARKVERHDVLLHAIRSQYRELRAEASAALHLGAPLLLSVEVTQVKLLSTVNVAGADDLAICIAFGLERANQQSQASFRVRARAIADAVLARDAADGKPVAHNTCGKGRLALAVIGPLRTQWDGLEESSSRRCVSALSVLLRSPTRQWTKSTSSSGTNPGRVCFRHAHSRWTPCFRASKWRSPGRFLSSQGMAGVPVLMRKSRWALCTLRLKRARLDMVHRSPLHCTKRIQLLACAYAVCVPPTIA